MEAWLILALWVVVFTGLALASFPRTSMLLWAGLAAWVGAIVYAAAADPTPWEMNAHRTMILTVFVVPLSGRLTGTVAHRTITGADPDAFSPKGTDGFDTLAGALTPRDCVTGSVRRPVLEQGAGQTAQPAVECS